MEGGSQSASSRLCNYRWAVKSSGTGLCLNDFLTALVLIFFSFFVARGLDSQHIAIQPPAATSRCSDSR
jgi:hypothetical protein